MQTSASMSSRSSGLSPASPSSRRASWSQSERAAATAPTLPAAKVVSARHRGGDFRLVGGVAGKGAEGRELLDDHVALALVALVQASREQQRLSANERAV